MHHIRTPTQVQLAYACGYSRPVVESIIASLLCRGAGRLSYKGHRGAIIQTGMAVMAHNAATLVRIHEYRLSKRARLVRRRLRLRCRKVGHCKASINYTYTRTSTTPFTVQPEVAASPKHVVCACTAGAEAQMAKIASANPISSGRATAADLLFIAVSFLSEVCLRLQMHSMRGRSNHLGCRLSSSFEARVEDEGPQPLGRPGPLQ